MALKRLIYEELYKTDINKCTFEKIGAYNMKLPFKIDLTGKTAVVTGAGGVLCSEFSKALAACGASVALLDINLEAAQKYADEIVASGGKAKAYKANILDKEAVDKVSQEVISDFGGCDILINGAGGNNPRATTDKEYYEPGDIDSEIKSFFDLETSGVEFVFNLNFLGTLIPTQSFGKYMVEKGGVIINISSMNAFTPLTKIPAYSGAKAAISNFTQWLAVHFSKTNIRVNALAPGFFATDQNRALLFNEDGTPTARTGKILAATPMRRFGESEELIGTLLYLVSDEASSFVTGVVIPVDGGFSAYSGV
jgi:NAD(P)-dependent dehydrogenase (short-subunit alcohol dehydrogenase family)